MQGPYGLYDASRAMHGVALSEQDLEPAIGACSACSEVLALHTCDKVINKGCALLAF